MITVGALALNQTPLDWDHNLNNILKGIQKAREAKVSVLCCPELCITGYGCEDEFLSVAVCQMALTVLQEIIPYTSNIMVAVGLPLLHQGVLYNSACLIADQKILGFVPKQNLAREGVHYEPRWFKPWPNTVCEEMLLDTKLYPIGDLIFDVRGLRIGFEICEDAWVENRTGLGLVERGVDLILNPSASHFAFGKSEVRKRFVEEGARAFRVVYIYANLLGNEAGRLLYDGDTLIAAGEHLLAEGPRFSFQDHVLTTAVVDIKSLGVQRIGGAVNDPMISKTMNKEEEFARSVALGLYDYLRKSKTQGFVINLSGGADSSACVCLVYLMVQLGIQELGLENFIKKLNYIPEIVTVKTAEDCLQKILYCLYQATSNNSLVTEKAATELTRALKVPFSVFSIDKFVLEYTQLIQPIINREISWEKEDIAFQNIQSRVRVPSVWLLTNLRQAILLCTSNRSEASVGYTTMDGDTAGGLAPLAGIDKAFILKWLKWLEKEGLEGIGPIPALKAVTAQMPMAELRPLIADQTDEKDLMPYEWLDSIERLFIRDKRSPVEILQFMQQKYPSESLKSLAESIELFFTLWVQNQWKRERIAPSFHLDDENVDPKTGCRFPILSGGFKREIKIMWGQVATIDFRNSTQFK